MKYYNLYNLFYLKLYFYYYFICVKIMKLKFLKLNYIHNQCEKVWELKTILSFKKQFKINF